MIASGEVAEKIVKSSFAMCALSASSNGMDFVEVISISQCLGQFASSSAFSPGALRSNFEVLTLTPCGATKAYRRAGVYSLIKV